MNGEKYVFSNEVLTAGKNLQRAFAQIQISIRMILNRIFEDTEISVDKIVVSLKSELLEFDKTWVAFEWFYVLELMIIETDARWFITEAI